MSKDVVPYTPDESTRLVDLVGTAAFDRTHNVSAIESGVREYPDGKTEKYQRVEFE